MPDPELFDDPDLLDDAELPDAELVPDVPLEPLPEEELPVPEPLDAAVLEVWAEPGSVKATTPAPARPAAPTAAVTARNRACPRRRAAAGRGSSSAEFIGFPSWFSPQSGWRAWGSPVNPLCLPSERRDRRGIAAAHNDCPRSGVLKS